MSSPQHVAPAYRCHAAATSFLALFSIGLGGGYLIIPLMAAELFGVRLLGRLMGIVVTADGVAEAVSPIRG